MSIESTTGSVDELYDLSGAAKYCRLARSTMKHHLYVTMDLQADGVLGGNLVFRQDTLDAFLRARTPIGRPPTRPIEVRQRRKYYKPREAIPATSETQP